MASLVDVTGLGPFDDPPPDRGAWLVCRRVEMDANECGWLLELARFDQDREWALDGQLNAVAWLRWRTAMARPTAYEKLRVARALLARDHLRSAFETGSISYSAVRAISRLDEPDPDTDAALVRLAEVGSVADVELAVRIYEAHAEADLPPDERWSRRRVHTGQPTAGLARLEGVLLETEADLFNLAIDLVRDKLWRRDHQRTRTPGEEQESSGGDPDGRDGPDGGSGDPCGAAEETGAEGAEAASSGGDALAGRGVPRADALMAIIGFALDHLDRLVPDGDDDEETGGGSGTTSGTTPDRAMVHYVHHADSGQITRTDGTPVHPAVAATVTCGAARVDHTYGPGGETLRMGRRTRTWTVAQRRAIRIRDGWCRHPGCHHTLVEVHHVRHWEDGGPTDIDNGALLCPQHHHYHHAGFLITGDAEGALHFARPDGTPIGTTYPRPGGRVGTGWPA